ncbi:MAG: alginate export family protein [bacterium]|nr:alginate export family protein [bacterium]
MSIMSWRFAAVLACSCGFGVPSIAMAADEAAGFTVRGAVRLRYEAIDGQARLGFNKSDDLVNIRTNILAEYRTGDVRFGVEIYDSRVFGDDAGTPVTTGEINALEPVQAYIAADMLAPFGKGSMLTLTAGRMMLNLGSRRLVAADDYRNSTNSYTGGRADLVMPHGLKATLIYTLPQVRLPDGGRDLRDAKVRLDRESFDLVLWGGLIAKSNIVGSAMGEISYFHLGERDAPGRPTRDRSLNTVGARIIAEPHAGAIDYEVDALFQTGQLRTSLAPGAAQQAVRASFLHADVGYSFAGAWHPRLSVEVDRASGDRRGGRYGRFDTLFGMRRADLAPAGLYNALARTNILTPGVRVDVAPSQRIDGFAAYRAMWLAADEDSFSGTGVRDASGRSGDFAGHQIEARVRYWLVPRRLRFEWDGLLLAKGRFLRDAPNATAGRWTTYGSFNLTASF